MTTGQPAARRDLLLQVAQQIPVSRRPLLVAIDGADGSGKTTFGDELARSLRGRVVVRASVDDFHFPREHRYAAGRTGETVWGRSFDYRAMRRELLDPWLAGAGSPYRRCWHDLESDAYVDEQPSPVPGQGVLVVDCLFAQRAELRDVWDLVVWLECPDQVRLNRMVARDGRPPAPDHPDQRRYLDAQTIYRNLWRPAESADMVVDNSDPGSPHFLGEGVPPWSGAP
jgi:uridine kinase